MFPRNLNVHLGRAVSGRECSARRGGESSERGWRVRGGPRGAGGRRHCGRGHESDQPTLSAHGARVCPRFPTRQWPGTAFPPHCLRGSLCCPAPAGRLPAPGLGSPVSMAVELRCSSPQGRAGTFPRARTTVTCEEAAWGVTPRISHEVRRGSAGSGTLISQQGQWWGLDLLPP